MELSSRKLPMHPLTQDQVDAILSRSASGEGVVNILREMELPIYESLEYLTEKHQGDVIVAKRKQRGEPV